MTEDNPLIARHVILASASRTRQEMLSAAGVELEAIASAVDEDEVKRSLRQEGAPVGDVALALAELKAARVSRRNPGALVIGADQMLECGGQWFDKPADRDHAIATLTALSGKTHHLVSAAVVAEDGRRVWGQVDRVSLTMRPLSSAFIDAYLDQVGDGALSSVGAYQLEGLGAQLFTQVEGDFFTVLGVPLLPLLGYLRDRGVLLR